MSNNKNIIFFSSNNRYNFAKACSCGKLFNVRSTFYKHRNNCKVAKSKADIRLGNFICKEEGCDYRAKGSRKFIEHLKYTHMIEKDREVRSFKKYSEFIAWKEDFERQTKAFFVLKNSDKGYPVKREYHYCNRSGNYTTRSTGKRSTKQHGIRKIGFNCPASIIVSVDEITDNITVTVHPLHYGHDNELVHIPIPKSDRAYFASQLSQGLTKAEIVKKICSEEKGAMERKHLCTNRDLYNISRAYGIKAVENKRQSEEQEALEVLYEVTVTTSAEHDAEQELGQSENFENESGENKLDNSVEEHFMMEYVVSESEMMDRIKTDLLNRCAQLTEKIKNCNNVDLLLTVEQYVNCANDLFDLKTINCE